MAGHIASAKDTSWTTEKRIVERVRKAFKGFIGLDPCSNDQSIVGANRSYSLPEKNGLTEPWDAETIFFNPPFGRSYNHEACNTLCVPLPRDEEHPKTTYFCTKCKSVLRRKDVKGSSIADWVSKGRFTSEFSDVLGVIGLMPAAVGSRHFHKYVWDGATAIFFPKGRFHFGGEPLETAEKANDSGGTAPMDCCLVYWGSDADSFEDAFSDIGHVDRLDLQGLAKAERATTGVRLYDSLKELETMPSVGDLQSPAASSLRSEAA